jgi:hypothetical protein
MPFTCCAWLPAAKVKHSAAVIIFSFIMPPFAFPEMNKPA